MSYNNRPVILLINHSDTRGGASVVSMRLMHALCRNGVDARMLVVHKDTDDLRVDVCAGKSAVRTAFIAEEARLYAADGFSRRNIFKLSTGLYGVDLLKHPWVAEADAFVLNWVNQGMMSLDAVGRLCALGKPVAWTMHDMWNLTSLCHHAGTCTQYAERCADCPMIKSKGLARKVFSNKERLYDNTHIHFVPVSNWLAGKCRQSTLLSRADITVIPNAFPVEDFGISPTLTRAQLHLPADGDIVVMGAARLDDPVKNLPLAVDALNALAGRTSRPFTAVFYGALRDGQALSALRIPHLWLGPVDSRKLPQLYAHASAVLSTSHYETLPGTLVEGMAAGATPVACGEGGQPDIIDNGVNGYLTGSDATAVAEALTAALDHPFDRTAQHNAVSRMFDRNIIAKKYLNLLNI